MRLNAFKDTVMEQLEDKEFRLAYFGKAIQCYQEGDPKTGRAMLKDYLEANEPNNPS